MNLIILVCITWFITGVLSAIAISLKYDKVSVQVKDIPRLIFCGFLGYIVFLLFICEKWGDITIIRGKQK